MGNITIQGDLTGGVPGGEVGGASNLTTVGAIPYVSSAGVLNQDATKLFWDATLGRLATANIKDPTTNNAINLGLWPNGTATQSILTLYNNSAGGSAQYAQFTIVGPGSSSETRILTGANTGTAGDIVMSPGGTERVRFVRSTGNLLIGTTTDDAIGRLQVVGTSGASAISSLVSVAQIRAVDNSDARIASVVNNKATFLRSAPTYGSLNSYDYTAGAARLLSVQEFGGNTVVGSTTDLGYGLHAANKGTNGNLLVFDPTATTGSTKCVARAGQGQSGNIFEIRSYVDGVYASFSATGSLSIPQGAIYNSKVGFGYNSTNEIFLTSDSAMKWMVGASISGTYDASLSRASANILQVGDGGANANGYLSAARIGVGTGSPSTPLEIYYASGNPTHLRLSSGGNTGSDYVAMDFLQAGVQKAVMYTNSNNLTLNVATGSMTLAPSTQLVFTVNSSERARFAATSGNLLIGTTTDGNFKLDVANSGSSGTFRVYDQTATTGNTKEVIRAGAGQSTNLTEWQNNAGTVLTYLASGGNISTDAAANFGTDVYFKNGGATQPNKIVASGPNSWLRLGQSVVIAWDNNTNALGGSMDSGLKRAAAGYVAVTDGSTGLGKIVVSQSTPSASTDAGTAGAIWADANYIYVQTGSSTVKRISLTTF